MFVYLYCVLYKIFKNFINAAVTYYYLLISWAGQDCAHSHREEWTPLLEHPVVPPMDRIQRVEISREIITNYLNYKISHLQISQKSLSNIIYSYWHCLYRFNQLQVQYQFSCILYTQYTYTLFTLLSVLFVFFPFLATSSSFPSSHFLSNTF